MLLRIGWRARGGKAAERTSKALPAGFAVNAASVAAIAASTAALRFTGFGSVA